MIGTGPLVSMRDVTKQFPGVVALDHVSFELMSGEIHALLGENGAGKSTLIKIISGVYPPTSGEVYIRGTLMHSFTPSSARGLGVGTVYQGLSLVPSLTVTQNLFLGHEQARSEEHTSELQSRLHLVCRLLLEKKKKKN